jgi:hypothetical protein
MSKKILAYCPLHYGAEYLDAAIRSVDPYVEKILILYTPTPSYGYRANRPCPESEQQLKDIAFSASNKIEWFNIGGAGAEWIHRGMALNYTVGRDYDGILAFDADEVFGEDLPNAIEEAFSSKSHYIGVDGYINFWKSFNYACYDGFRPIRFTNLRVLDESRGEVKCTIYHFSTAQRMEIMEYKLQIHGHFSEIRPNWLEAIYKTWTPEQNQQDLHLVALGLWNAVPYDKSTMPQILKDHPNYNKEVIL